MSWPPLWLPREERLEITARNNRFINRLALAGSRSFSFVHGDPARSRSFLGQDQPADQHPQKEPHSDFQPRMSA